MTDERHLFKAGCAIIGIYSQDKVVASHCEVSKNTAQLCVHMHV